MVSFFISVFLSVSAVQAKTCQRIFALKDNPIRTIVQTPLNYQLDKTKNAKGNILLIHGLGDDLIQLNRLTKHFIHSGYTVLRIDLHGHGKSLKDGVPYAIDYNTNVRDALKVIDQLQFDAPLLIGHSYGGAVAYALANQLGNHPTLKPKGLIMMGPYLRRLDHNFLTGNPIIDAQTQYISEAYMRQNFWEHYSTRGADRIDARVDAALATMRGIRDFDILSSHKRAAPKTKLNMLILGGNKDQAVTVDYLEAFHNKLRKEGYAHEFKILEGDHFFPQNNSEQTAKAIIDFLKEE